MFLALVFGLIQLLLMMTVTQAAAADPLGGKSNLEETVAAAGGDGDSRRAAMDDGKQSELVSRRRLYDEEPMAWNNHDIAWLKRAGADAPTGVERRGWGNGIPPWMRRRVVVVPISAEADRRSAKP